jgi:hypothetical protein
MAFGWKIKKILKCVLSELLLIIMLHKLQQIVTVSHSSFIFAKYDGNVNRFVSNINSPTSTFDQQFTNRFSCYPEYKI